MGYKPSTGSTDRFSARKALSFLIIGQRSLGVLVKRTIAGAIPVIGTAPTPTAERETVIVKPSVPVRT